MHEVHAEQQLFADGSDNIWAIFAILRTSCLYEDEQIASIKRSKYLIVEMRFHSL